MKISHRPLSMRLRIGCRRPSQALKSPTTRHRRAFGAQTAKCTPSTPSWRIRCAPSRSYSAAVRAFDQQMVVERPEHRAEGVGVDHPPRSPPRWRRAGGSRAAAARRAAGASKKPAGSRAASAATGAAVGSSGSGVVGARHEGAQRPRRRRSRCGPSTANGSPWRAASMAAMSSSRPASQDCPMPRAVGSAPSAPGTRQMSSAYSRIARSEENQPMLAVFSDARAPPGRRGRATARATRAALRHRRRNRRRP